jgi:hypothetical protein
MLFGFVSIATVVLLGALALRSLIHGVAEHLEADDVRPRLPRAAQYRTPVRVSIRATRVYPASVAVTTQQYSRVSLSHR